MFRRNQPGTAALLCEELARQLRRTVHINGVWHIVLCVRLLLLAVEHVIGADVGAQGTDHRCSPGNMESTHGIHCKRLFDTLLALVNADVSSAVDHHLRVCSNQSFPD